MPYQNISAAAMTSSTGEQCAQNTQREAPNFRPQTSTALSDNPKAVRDRVNLARLKSESVDSYDAHKGEQGRQYN